MIYLPATKFCSQKKGIATFDYSVNLPACLFDSTVSEIFIVGHYLGSSFRVDHKETDLHKAITLCDSQSVILRVFFDVTKIY